MPRATAIESTIQPDLVLRVRQQTEAGGHRLTATLEVRNRYLGLEIREHEYPPMSIEGELEEVLSSHFEDVGGMELATEAQRQLARRRLASSGVRLGEDLCRKSCVAFCGLCASRNRRPVCSCSRMRLGFLGR